MFKQRKKSNQKGKQSFDLNVFPNNGISAVHYQCVSMLQSTFRNTGESYRRSSGDESTNCLAYFKVINDLGRNSGRTRKGTHTS